MTGAGKTDALHALAATGAQTLDLEGLAMHRGSAFGGIGLPAQPSAGDFAARVDAAVGAADPDSILWVEDEGPFIGAVGLPDWLQAWLAETPVIELAVPVSARVERLTAIYANADPAELLAALGRTRRRLGAPRAADASALVRRGDVHGAIELVLPYFDAAYRHRIGPGERHSLGTVASAGELMSLTL